jgi:DNA ligase-associated metallophosphoesterase
MKINIRNQNLILDYRKAIYWEDAQTLLVTDLHLGKSGYFQSFGIASPDVIKQDLNILQTLINQYNPKSIIMLGDLFHAGYNYEWDEFYKFKNLNSNLNFNLVLGNHDEYNIEKIKRMDLNLIDMYIIQEPFIFVHKPEDIKRFKNIFSKQNNEMEDIYPLCGHVHPGVRLIGKADQSEKMQCFYFSEKYAILPSFGSFTGRYYLKPEKESNVYLIADSKIIKAKRLV